ncbi:MAG: hypothetical protein ACM3Q4_10850 [Acidobacteriota bacterium]
MAQQHSQAQAGPTDASMWIYLWDIVDEGYEHVFSFLKERRLTSLSVAGAYHAGKFLAVHNPKRKVVFLEDGTIYFTPDPRFFGAIKPQVNSLVTEGHHLGSVARSAERFGLETRAWVVCCHNSRIGALHPSACTETAFGDRLIHNLCPNNPDVRAYLRGLVRSLAAQGIGTIELEAMQFQGYAHGMHHEREGIPLPLGIRYLLGLCFCPSCRREAEASHAEFARVKAWTLRTLGEYFADPSPANEERYASLDALPAELFAPFDRWREDAIVRLAGELSDAVSTQGIRLLPMTSLDPIAQRMAAMNPQKVSEVTGGILALGYIREGAALRAPLEALKSRLGPARRLTVGMHVGMPESGGKSDFLARMSAARALGITRFNFYNYGFVPLSHIDWIAEALA